MELVNASLVSPEICLTLWLRVHPALSTPTKLSLVKQSAFHVPETLHLKKALQPEQVVSALQGLRRLVALVSPVLQIFVTYLT